ncbi:MAG: alpha/beta fold hydrolase, partial [Actinomycetota bacterium]
MDGGIVSAVGGGVRRRSMRATIVGLLAVVVLAGSCSVPLLDDSANESTPADDPTGDDGQPADETAEGTDAGGTGTGGVGPLDRRPATCPFDVETVTEVECGVVTLPGGGEDPDFTVEIMFARFAATGEADAVEPDPVVFLHGGPGGRAVEDAPWIYDDVVAPHIASRDVILYDQRGGGRSTPELRCSSADLVSIRARAEAGTATRMVLAMEGALEECARRRFESGEIDPTAYSTIANVRDLVGLLAALDVDEYNIHGLSYGSRLAQAVLRDAPDGVRSVVLSGVYPTDVSPFHHVPATMETALDHIFVGCLADPDCGEALSDPWASFEALVADLDRKPTWVQGAPGRSEITPEVFDGDRFLAAVHGTLYARDGAGSITDLLIDVEAGDRSRLRRLADHSVGRPESLLTSLLVVCADEMAFPADRDDLIRPERQFLAEWVDPVGLLGANTPRYCDALGVDWPADGQDDPVTWEVPTLILAGAADPITPARWARLVADRLPRARLVVNPASTHDADSGWCASAALR